MAKPTFHCKLAKTEREIDAYFQLRQAIFCEEQQLFTGSDRDKIDLQAYPIVAIAVQPAGEESIVGVVRIYETQPGYWYGGRLGVHRDFRRRGRIGKQLIEKAVTTANAWGCQQFLATVQLQNVRFFQRLHWASVEEITICDRPHHLMAADLAFYPPTQEIRPTQPPLLVTSLVTSG
ncbi:MAG: MSMEG_0567/Sll0786 family nitrogen starvation N-acetyltransferase [Cyanobacteria bacterium J06641_5]